MSKTVKRSTLQNKFRQDLVTTQYVTSSKPFYHDQI